MRYAYGVAMALLLGGTAFSVATGQAGAQVAQNAPSAIVPRAGAPESFADLAARLAPAVVNISTKQRVPVRNQADPFEEFFRRFGGPNVPQVGPQGGGPRTRDIGGTATVPVVYEGSVPDLFKRGRDIAIDGTLRNGTFVGVPGTLVTKCPSKYTPKKQPPV